MGVKIKQSTSAINGAYTDLLYYVTSSNATGSFPQFKFVMDVYESGSSTRLSRQVQPRDSDTTFANAMFNPSIVFQDDLEFDRPWKTNLYAPASSSFKTYELKFGVQYGTSISSSVTVYPDQTIVTASIGNATKYANDGSYNRNRAGNTSISAFDCYLPVPTTGITSSLFLTDCPNHKPVPDNSLVQSQSWEDILYLSSSDYHTISLIQPANNSVIDYGTVVYDKTGTSIYTLTTAITGSTNVNELMHLGVGPKNIGVVDWNTVAYVDVILRYSTNIMDKFTYRVVPEWQNNTIANATKYQPFCNDRTRFAFLNRYGAWDYYNAFNPKRRRTEIERVQGYEPNVDYGSLQGIRYDEANRGLTDIYKKFTDRYFVNTGLLSKRTYFWLRQLFDSPSVYIQEGDDFIPIVITNANIPQNLNQNRNKNFNLDIEFIYANPRRSRTHLGEQQTLI